MSRQTLTEAYPEIAAEWHPTKNQPKTPESVTSKNGKSYWWVCPRGHEYRARVSNRTANGSGCPYCSGKKLLVGFNDLATTDPLVAEEWAYDKNNGLTPKDIKRGLHTKYWWRCGRGHTWKASANQRTSTGSGCPTCRRFDSFPEKAVLFYALQGFPDAIGNARPELKGLGRGEFDVWIPSVMTAIEYDGEQWHKNADRDKAKDEVCSKNGVKLIRIRERGCPEYASTAIVVKRTSGTELSLNAAIQETLASLGFVCNPDVERDSGEIRRLIVKPETLMESNPELSAQWHPTKNGSLTADMVAPSGANKVWWLGDCGHEWQAKINNRANGAGCPFCAGKRVLPGFNDLASRNPGLSREWHPSLNKAVTPADVTTSSGKRVFWLGKCGHEWQAKISDRSKGAGCPYCAGRKVLPGFNDLATRYPDVASEWDYSQNNGLLPTDVTGGSNKKVFWLGKCGHGWQATIASRTGSQKHGCPYCSGNAVLPGFNDLATVLPNLAMEWDFEKNGKLTPDQITAHSNKKVYWHCLGCGNVWKASVNSRSYGNCGCGRCGKAQ